jgi:lauroyl/myristoyl acyltransferase
VTPLLLVGSVIVAFAFYCLWQSERQRASVARAKASHLGQINKQQQEFIEAVHHVLEREAGGVLTRLSQHAKLAEAIQKRAPDIVRAEPDLVIWLNGHHCFYKALRDAAQMER